MHSHVWSLGSIEALRHSCAYLPAGDATRDVYTSVSALVKALGGAGLLSRPEAAPEAASMRKVGFVFGREVTGLTASEIADCNAVCRLPMGRLAESLSLGHAVAIALSAAYEYVTEAEE